MINYKLPPSLRHDIDKFEQHLFEFKKGELHETAFTAKRVKMGSYMERSYKTYMCRIRCPGNLITPKQLKAIAELADKYGDSRVHVTTRAEIQIHGVDIDNLVTVFRELSVHDLTSKGGGGHTVRNIISNHDSGINPSEVFDIQPHARALTERLIEEADSFELPRKFKTAFCSLPEDTVGCELHDFGFIARMDEKRGRGFRVFAGGGLGAKPKIGILLHEFLPEGEIFHAARAIKNVFHTHGNRKNKHRNRIRFLIHDDLGEDTFKKFYFAELEKLLEDDSLKLNIRAIDNEENQNRQINLNPCVEDFQGYETWRKRNTFSQKQNGLISIRLPLNLGNLKSSDCVRLAETLSHFGENVLRCGVDQNFHIRNIPEKYLKTVYKCIASLDTLSDKPLLFGNLIPCTGAQTCQIGINFPRPATTAVFKQFEKSGIDFDIIDDVIIRISGCPNSCANHWAGDLAFFGKVRRVEGYSIPTYNVLGGALITGEKIELAEKVGWVHSYDLPRFITEVLKHYQFAKSNSEDIIDFRGYWRSGGRDYIKSLCMLQFNSIPTFEEDKNYYFDHGAKEIFSVKDMGKAECSAGIYDMIDVDVKIIRKNIKNAGSNEVSEKEVNEALKEIAFSASRMLLVTRGEDPKSNRENYDLFIKHFIDTGLVPERFRGAVETVSGNNASDLSRIKGTIIGLGEEVIALYKGMDNTMRFPGETENLAIRMEEKNSGPVEKDLRSFITNDIPERKKTFDRFKDLRGVKCPINFAQTKVQLASMKSGEILKIYLDDGEPIHNVPGSVRLDGHKVLRQEDTGEYWEVEIQKA